MTIPASTASIHAVLSKHLADLEAAGERPCHYVYRFDNSTYLRVTEKVTIVGLLQASTFEGDETEDRHYSHFRNRRGDYTDIVSFRLARKLDMEKLQGMLIELEVEDRTEIAA
jgi:hypothetical protein